VTRRRCQIAPLLSEPMTYQLEASQPHTGFEAIDRAGISRFQWKIMFVSGMGFFTAAYDLFVIGIVV